MHNRTEISFTVIKVPLDYLMLILAALSAYALRFERSITEIKPVLFDLPFREFLGLSAIVAAGWILFFAIAKLYSFNHIRITDEISRVILACSSGLSATIMYMFFVRELFDSRFIVLTAWGLSILYVIIARSILRKIRHYFFLRGKGAHKVVIIGNNKETHDLIQTINSHPPLGMRIIAHFPTPEEATTESLEELHRVHVIDDIIQTDSTISRKDTLQLLDFAEAHNITFKYAAGTFEARTTNITVDMVAGIPVIQIKKTRLDGWGNVWKRLIDIVGSIILIILFSPVMLITAIAIKLDSKGPVIYKNERVKKNGTFYTLKFRSMFAEYSIGPQFKNYTDQQKALAMEQSLIKEKSERQGPVYKIIDDPRRTPVGRFIERTSIDELPQLFNVLFGSMSLVGPRPHQPREVEKYQGYQRRVLDIKPGITGLAQISGRSDLAFDEEVKLDTYYIENWALKLDFWILLKTPWVVLNRKTKS